MTALADAVQRVVGELSDAHIDALRAAYAGASARTTAAEAAALRAVPVPHRGEVERVNQAWAESPDIPGSGIALALESSRLTARTSDVAHVDVVVTGPDSPDAPVRLTSEVVTQLINGSQKRVTMVSYAAYQMPAVITALDAAVERGVKVTLILESPAKLDGGGGAHHYARFATYHWPVDHREPPDAKLHAKAVIVDSEAVLLTSANMTSAAYDKNIELGVLCRGGGIADQVQRHFDALIRAGTLAAAG